MDKLAPFHDVHFLEAVLYVIFHGLYVVVCDLFYFFHLGCIFRSHCPVDVTESFES